MKWSIYAGLYVFVCGTARAFILYDILTLLADVIGLPAPYSMVILASSTLLIGTVVWWVVVERRDSYTYLFGGTFGLLTALFTGGLWSVRLVSFWGFDMLEVPVISFLVVFVLGIAVVAGIITGLPLMNARRRLDSRLAGGQDAVDSSSIHSRRSLDSAWYSGIWRGTAISPHRSWDNSLYVTQLLQLLE